MKGKFIFRKLIRYGLVPFGMINSIFSRKNKIIILMYHRINNEVEKELAVRVDNFAWQMGYLKKGGYNVISLGEAIEKIRKRDIKGKYVVLTFDDGYEDYYQNAFPLLRKNGFPSMVYLVPGFIGTGRVFWWDEDLWESRLMEWSQIEELNRSGIVDFGSHTLNHYDLDKLDKNAMRRELLESKEIIESKLHRKIVHFCYPRGIFTTEAECIIRECYESGVLIFRGKKILDKLNPKYLYRLKRIPIQNSDGKYLFIARIKGWLIFEEVLRKLFGKL